MKSLFATGALILAGFVSAAASSQAAETGCAADVAYAASVLEKAATERAGAALSAMTPVEENGRCILRDVSLPLTEGMVTYTFEADEVAWTAHWGAGGREIAPQKLVLEMTGARNIPMFEGMPESIYQMRLIGERSRGSVHLDYELDPERKELALNRFEIDMGSGTRMRAAARLGDFDLPGLLAVPAQMDKAAQIRLHELDLKLENGGFFESMSAVWIAFLYPAYGDTPENAVAAAKQLLAGQVESLPDQLVDQESRKALASIIASVPHPSGLLHVNVSSAKGVSALDFAPLAALEPMTLEAALPYLEGVKITVRHDDVPSCVCESRW
ncbi:hypothetical protein V6L76_19395 [Pannonibacter sp. Pt2]|uniref:Uncharacterized protein n=1 Tax=Pannonibacter anstelovis TaxID=3121537 RepID=A0ABU7ZTR5_9HYPH